ncbi:CAZyme family GH95 [Trichoderma harzianum]|nr:CAZyme family GH95 [Trichoderma harzianum]
MKVAVVAALAMSQTGVAARKFWTSKPADPGNVLMTGFTIGNGRQGDESALYGGSADYGSYEALANLTVSIAGVTKYSKYKRTLDLETALHSAEFTANGASFSTVQFCSFPDQVCVYHVSSNKPLPQITFGLVDNYRTNPPSTVKCSSSGIWLSGRTVADDGEGLIGMKIDAQARALPSAGLKATCNSNGQTVLSTKSVKSATIVVASGTEYDATKGNAAHNYSFRGADPYPGVVKTISAVSKKSYNTILQSHVKDHGEWFNKFTLDLPDPHNSADVDTMDLLTNYSTEKGDPFVENLLIEYGQYMFIASSRPGSLPPNLQGSWAPDGNPAWSSDYHIDVNVQMNHWHVEKMGLGGLTDPLWDFMTYTWVPRGTETANLWYNVSGWVAFTNTNIFGHTAQENDATWSNVAHDIAWMMAHVWDRYDYGRDKKWYASVGYPLMKGVASFWVDMMVPDGYFNDGTLVANPCNSPEHGPTTFGCSQFQQVVWELFDHIIKDWDASGDTDTAFLKRVKESYSKLDPGVHWKMDIDTKNDTHRHLSHLYGFYPGYVISSVYADNKTVMDAVATSLYSRGNGTEDSNTGWEKVWRGACWGQLGVTDEAYKELKYTIDMNFAANGLSVYTTGSWPYEVTLPFQIDANFGLSANALAMLYTDLPKKWGDKSIQKVILGPAIPKEWAGGSVKGGSLRGGGTVDFSWDDEGVVNRAVVHGRRLPLVVVNKNGKVLATH